MSAVSLALAVVMSREWIEYASRDVPPPLGGGDTVSASDTSASSTGGI